MTTVSNKVFLADEDKTDLVNDNKNNEKTKYVAAKLKKARHRINEQSNLKEDNKEKNKETVFCNWSQNWFDISWIKNCSWIW